MFKADRQAQQAFADAELAALRRRQPLMRGRRRMGNEALGVAEIVADAHELERVLKTERALLAALDLEPDHRRAAAHLLLRHFGLRMIRPARIDQARNLAMLGERRRKCRGV